MAKQALQLAMALFAIGVSAVQAQCENPADYDPDATYDSFGSEVSCSSNDVTDIADFVPSVEACLNGTGLGDLLVSHLLAMVGMGCCSGGPPVCASYTMNPCADPAGFNRSAEIPTGDGTLPCWYIPAMKPAFEVSAEDCAATDLGGTPFSLWTGTFGLHCCADKSDACEAYLFNPCADKAAFDADAMMLSAGAEEPLRCGDVRGYIDPAVADDAGVDTCFEPYAPFQNVTSAAALGFFATCCTDGVTACAPWTMSPCAPPEAMDLEATISTDSMPCAQYATFFPKFTPSAETCAQDLAMGDVLVTATSAMNWLSYSCCRSHAHPCEDYVVEICADPASFNATAWMLEEEYPCLAAAGLLEPFTPDAAGCAATVSALGEESMTRAAVLSKMAAACCGGTDSVCENPTEAPTTTTATTTTEVAPGPTPAQTPAPTPAQTPPPTAAPTPSSQVWSLQSGPCQQEGPCISSPNFPSNYDDSQSCEIDVPQGLGEAISVVAFDTEENYDFLYVDGIEYDGQNSPDGVMPTSYITWSSDSGITRSGWKICLGNQVTTTTTTTTTTTSSTTQVAEDQGVVEQCEVPVAQYNVSPVMSKLCSGLSYWRSEAPQFQIGGCEIDPETGEMICEESVSCRAGAYEKDITKIIMTFDCKEADCTGSALVDCCQTCQETAGNPSTLAALDAQEMKCPGCEALETIAIEAGCSIQAGKFQCEASGQCKAGTPDVTVKKDVFACEVVPCNACEAPTTTATTTTEAAWRLGSAAGPVSAGAGGEKVLNMSVPLELQAT